MKDITQTKKGLYLTVDEIREIAKSSKDANEAMQECLCRAARKEQQQWMLEHISKIEITHIPDEEDEKRKWIEYNEATYIPQLSPDYWDNGLPDFATFCKAFQRSYENIRNNKI